MPGWVIGAGWLFLAASIVLFLVLVGKTVRASKPDWERMEEDEAQAAWLEKPDP